VIDRSTIKVDEASSSKRKYVTRYDSSYLELGFLCMVMIVNRNHSVLCYEVLSNESMKPAKL
jgi:hypothetical protein